MKDEPVVNLDKNENPLDERIVTEFNELYRRINALAGAVNQLSGSIANHEHGSKGQAVLPAGVGLPQARFEKQPNRG